MIAMLIEMILIESKIVDLNNIPSQKLLQPAICIKSYSIIAWEIVFNRSEGNYCFHYSLNYYDFSFDKIINGCSMITYLIRSKRSVHTHTQNNQIEQFSREKIQFNWNCMFRQTAR